MRTIRISTAVIAAAAVAMAADVARPTPEQLAWQDMEIGMFIHFTPHTYSVPPGDIHMSGAPFLRRFNPSELDVNQWIDVAESMTARYIVLVARHGDGFCLWPTATTRYSLSYTPYLDGKGDIVGGLARACARRGMKLGVYVCPRDDHRGVGNRGIVRSGLPEDQARYDEIYKQQLAELFTRYGEIFEVWFDGSTNGDLVGPIIRKYQPKAMVFQSSAATIRFSGSEQGVAPYPNWNTVAREAHLSGVARGSGDPDGDAWLPVECDVPIRKDWIWTAKNLPTLKTLDKLMDIYYTSVGRGANLLLNQGPDTTGVIPEADAKRSAEFGKEIKRRFGKAVAETRGRGDSLELSLRPAATVDHTIVMEDIQQGQRVREYKIEAFVNGAWQTVASGSSIGHKRIDRFDPVRTSRLRIVSDKSAATPQWRSFAAYHAGEQATQ